MSETVVSRRSSSCVAMLRQAAVILFCLLLGIYRPGSQLVTAAFFDELTAMFEQLVTLGHLVMVCGDFNVHVDQADNPHAVRLVGLQLLHAFGCIQHVAEPTHTAGHTLDLVITKEDTDVCDLSVGGMISDHALVKFTHRLYGSLLRPLSTLIVGHGDGCPGMT